MDPRQKQRALRQTLDQAQARQMLYTQLEADPIFGVAYGALAQLARQEAQMLRRILRRQTEKSRP